MCRKPPSKPDSGFVLLEVLIAAVLATITLVVVFHSYSTAFGGSERTERLTVALLAAETKLAELGVSESLRPGAISGQLTGGYRWRADVSPYGRQAENDFAAPPVTAYAVEVTVWWGNAAADSVTLSSLRLLPKDGYDQRR